MPGGAEGAPVAGGGWWEEKALRILLVTDERGGAERLQESLAEAGEPAIGLEQAASLADGCRRLAVGGFDAVLLDLSLPDSLGLETLERIRTAASGMPVVVLTSRSDEDLALAAVRAGAQDYLVKGRVDGAGLARSLRYALERARLQAELCGLAHRDELTGVLNRRGFLALAEHQHRLALRAGRPLAVVFADLDDLKGINDAFGHGLGDEALRATGELLRATLRGSDVLGRMGGDEFALLLADCDAAGAVAALGRLREALAAFNGRGVLPFAISLSVGRVLLEPRRPCSLAELLARADGAMYMNKRERFARGWIPRPAAGGEALAPGREEGEAESRPGSL